MSAIGGTMLKPAITLSQALDRFGSTFALSSFWTWKVVAKLIDGVPLTEPREIALFETCTGRKYNRQARRAWRRMIILVGRRGGKDRFLSAVACWRALSTDWRLYKSAGEGAVCILIGADMKQAGILRRYCIGLLQEPPFAKEVLRQTGEVIEFRNGSSLDIIVNDERLVRGRSAIAVLGSECCHWKTDEGAASNDAEVVSAAESSMAMTPDHGLLMLGSSVFRKKGYMYRQYRKLFGKEHADSLCWFATSQTMNPLLPQRVIDKALARDSEKARAEFLNVWREDSSDLLPLDIIEAATDVGIVERPPQRGVHYVAYADMATGTGKDSAALAVCHVETDAARSVLVDLVRERKPRFVMADVIADWSEVLGEYGIGEVWSDGYAFGICADEWSRHGIRNSKSPNDTGENYIKLLPLLTSKRGHLSDDPTTRKQLAGLVRVVRSGHETVEHASTASAHDDVAAAVAGALVQAASEKPPMVFTEQMISIIRSSGRSGRFGMGMGQFGMGERLESQMRRAGRRY